MSVAAIVASADWEEWLNLSLGFWVMVSPWMLGFAHTGAMHVGIWVGAIVAFVAALELWLVHFEPAMGSTPSFSGRMPPAIKFNREFN